MTEFNSKIKKNSRILKIFMFSICALFACAISSHAQSLVKGTVTDGIGEPLPGVSVASLPLLGAQPDTSSHFFY